MRFIVTGATSMIGSALIRVAIQHDIEIIAIIRENSSNKNRIPNDKRVTILECNLDSLATLIGKLPTSDVFYHFGWEGATKQNRDNTELQYYNFQYSQDAVKLAHSAHCQLFVFAGSQAEYGPTNNILSPDLTPRPSSSYGYSKYFSGMATRQYCRSCGINHVWARILSVYGPHDSDTTLVSHMVNVFTKAEDGFFSSAQQLWEFLYEDDAAEIFYLIGQKIREEKIYCISSGEQHPLRYYIEIANSIAGNKSHIHYSDETPCGLHSDVLSLFNDLDYKTKVSFEEGFKRCVKYHSRESGF